MQQADIATLARRRALSHLSVKAEADVPFQGVPKRCYEKEKCR